jgi:hypothetical protein
MLTHLYVTYGQLSPWGLQTNNTHLRYQYDPNQPIESLFDQIEDAVTLAAAAQAPYLQEQIVAIAYTLVFTTGMFPKACHEWRRHPVIEHTWSNFKTSFAKAHRNLRNLQLTSKQAGYHHANAATTLQHDTAEAIANLTSATTPPTAPRSQI